MKKIIFMVLFVVLCTTSFQSKADQVDAYPQGQGSQPPPQYEPAPQYQPGPPPYEPPPRRRRGWRLWQRDYPDDSWSQLRILVKAFYDTAATGNSNNATISNNFFSNNGALSVNMNTAPGFGAEVFMAPPFGVGFDAGLEYELARTISNLTNPNVSVTYVSSQPTLQFMDIYVNGIFRWLNFYLPVGLNYSIPNFSGGSGNGVITNSTFTGGVGFQIGLGYLIGEHFSLVLEDRVLGFSATSSSGNTSLNWGNVSLSGLHFDVKFAF